MSKNNVYYYVLTIQPDEPVHFYFATQDEFEDALEFAKTLEGVVIDYENTGAVDFHSAADAMKFLQDVWG